MNARKQAELNSATSAVAILLTGAFILGDMGVTPFLDRLYFTIAQSAPPRYFSLAIGSVGAFAIVYHLAYVLLIRPLECFRGEYIELVEEIDPNTVAPKDVVNLILIYMVYLYLLWVNNLISSEPLYGGLMVIAAGMSFVIVPRMVARFTDTDWCYYGLVVVALSVPICIIIYLPVVFLLVAI